MGRRGRKEGSGEETGEVSGELRDMPVSQSRLHCTLLTIVVGSLRYLTVRGKGVFGVVAGAILFWSYAGVVNRWRRVGEVPYCPDDQS